MKNITEIRDPLHGIIRLTKSEMEILNHPALQRLRSIKQLDFMEFSFPGATHSRFLHSLGSFHLASLTFDHIFKKFPFSSSSVRNRIKTTFKLSALLHDLGHGPLSHASEKAMPSLSKLWTEKLHQVKTLFHDSKRKARHEDYTIRFIIDSSLNEKLKSTFSDIDPFYIACLIENELKLTDDFFIDQGFNFRPILSQLISSDLDVDRMDYLGRDAYFCGINFIQTEWDWLISNMVYYEKENQLYLALNRRALSAFEQFLLTRHHMRLMVYFHQKSLIYKELLERFFSFQKKSEKTFELPSNIEEYTLYTDHTLNEHLKEQAKEKNPWAKRIVEHKPYKLLFENYSEKHQFLDPKNSKVPTNIKGVIALNHSLEKEGFNTILSLPSKDFHFKENTPHKDSHFSSKSFFPSLFSTQKNHPPIFLIHAFNPNLEPCSIASEQSLRFFKHYEQTHHVERLYVSPEDYNQAKLFLKKKAF